MKVSDILRVKGNVLYSAQPDQRLSEAVRAMSELDIGSLVVMDHGRLTGLLTFREVLAFITRNGGTVGDALVRDVSESRPLTCSPGTEIGDVRRMMLERHARYLPVLDGDTLLGVISFYDVARAIVETQDFENRMLKAYISDTPAEHAQAGSASAG